jgi:hypothetical protein
LLERTRIVMLTERIKQTADNIAGAAIKQMIPDVHYELLLSVLSAMYVRGWAAAVSYLEVRDGRKKVPVSNL